MNIREMEDVKKHVLHLIIKDTVFNVETALYGLFSRLDTAGKNNNINELKDSKRMTKMKQ